MRLGGSGQTNILNIIIREIILFDIRRARYLIIRGAGRADNDMQIESLDLCQALSGARLDSLNGDWGADMRRTCHH